MIIDSTLKDRVDVALLKRPRKHVTVADALAVMHKESGWVPTFSEKDDLFHQNLRAASKISGLDEQTIRQVMTIQSGPLKGLISKFRCEPGYWEWAKKYKDAFTPRDRLLLSSSFGVGQKMARWLVTGTPTAEWIPTIKNFMGSVNLQVAYVVGDVESLLAGSRDDRPLAYTRYNAGPSATKENPAYKEYGLVVEGRRKEIQKLLEAK